MLLERCDTKMAAAWIEIDQLTPTFGSIVDHVSIHRCRIAYGSELGGSGMPRNPPSSPTKKEATSNNGVAVKYEPDPYILRIAVGELEDLGEYARRVPGCRTGPPSLHRLFVHL
jgi:hypothetical protein